MVPDDAFVAINERYPDIHQTFSARQRIAYQDAADGEKDDESSPALPYGLLERNDIRICPAQPFPVLEESIP